ncbi:non-canonical purine NTP pyrophosphatase [Mucisphaera sp.]|uniref:non-canonical purine NTP pyrophosphatase n=1 Tax=Mucisphaera sp. TaxID=2913024 RepID=UPI003D0C3316
MADAVRELLIATGNPHKVEEIGAALARHVDGLRLLSLSDVSPGIEEPVEDRGTFAGNAALKAVAYAKATGLPCLADDSGLVVEALGGEPGVDSAYFAKEWFGDGEWEAMPRGERDRANNRKLLESLKDKPVGEREARFLCTMVLAGPEPVKQTRTDVSEIPADLRGYCSALVVGEVLGHILLPEEADNPAEPHLGRGANGFGYDPLFLLAEDAPHPGMTTAQLTAEQKNAISHRGRACAKLVAFGVV